MMNAARWCTFVSVLVVVPAGFALKYYEGPLDRWVNNSVAGVLYVVFWSLCLYFVRPRPSAVVPIVVAVLIGTSLVEVLQLWHPAWLDAIRRTFVGRTVLGTTFVWTDFAWYVVGAVMAWGWLAVLSRRCVLRAAPEEAGP